MKIWIEPDSLTGKTDDLLAPGALFALKRLTETGYSIGTNMNKLTDRQQELLENEKIRFTDVKKRSSDFEINSDDNSELLVIVSNNTEIADGNDWIVLTRNFLFPVRKTTHRRTTKETDLYIELNLDGSGECEIDTGLAFFDHMLQQIGSHGLIDLKIHCKGDLDVDEHHSIEDTAIALGEAIYTVCGADKTGLRRYGFLLAMDDSQAEVALDLSNRPYLVWNATFKREYAGDFPLEMAEHFFHTLAMNMRATLHIRAEGKNDHHKIEAIFKGFARALRQAVSRTERTEQILPSSKGVL